MKIEDAIEILKNDCYVFKPLNFGRTTLINTALDTVIEALEKKSCKESEKAFKYDILVKLLFSKSYLSRYSEKLGIDSYNFSGIKERLEPESMLINLRILKSGKRRKKINELYSQDSQFFKCK